MKILPKDSPWHLGNRGALPLLLTYREACTVVWRDRVKRKQRIKINKHGTIRPWFSRYLRSIVGRLVRISRR